MTSDDGAEPGLAPINREPTAALIAGQLRTAILRGTLEQGTQLGEADLAAKLGVSRGPLREAMQRLVQEGLLYNERHRGIFVITLDDHDVQDIYLARLAVETAAATRILRGDRSRAVELLTDAQRAIASAAASGDPAALADADQEFHQTLVRASGSARLQRMAETLLAETRMCLAALQRSGPILDELAAEHQALLDAFRAGDPAPLARLLEEHMASACRRIVTESSATGPSATGPSATGPSATGLSSRDGVALVS